MIFIILSAILLFLWKSGQLIVTCKPANDSTHETKSDNGNRLENVRDDNQVTAENQHTSSGEITLCPNVEQKSSAYDQYIDLNLAGVGNTTYTDLKNCSNPSTFNTFDELHKYDTINVKESRPGAEDPYIGLNTHEIVDTTYMGLLKSNEQETGQMSLTNPDEAKAGVYENGNIEDETSDYEDFK